MKRLVRIILLLTAITFTGTSWFWLVEGWPFLDALYMTVITLSTVGFHEVQPLSPRGRIFVILLIVAGLGIFLYGIVQLGEAVVRAELRQWWKKGNMTSDIKALADHVVVCGFGRMGRMVCRHLAARGIPFVAIDREESAFEECKQRNWPILIADATEEDTLDAAGIERARALAAVLSNDADNLYVVMSARMISQHMRIISRAFDDKGVQKMEKAGADRVVSLYKSGATKMAQLLVNPHIDDFFEIVSDEGVKFDLAELRIDESSPLVGKALAETDFRDRGIMIVGIRRTSGEVLLPPPSDAVIRLGDELFALGSAAAIHEFTQ